MSLTAPASVRTQFRKGIALVRDGYAGRGLRGETVRWAERLADGEPITLAKARKMRAWFARHGAAVAESARRMRDPKAPSAVAWLLWGGDPSIPYRPTGWRDPVAAWLRDVLADDARPRRRAVRNGRRAHRNGIEIVDTRQYDYEGGRWRPVPGTGDPRPCSCCGRPVVIHVFVGGVLYGDRCAKAKYPIDAKAVAAAKDRAIDVSAADVLRRKIVGRTLPDDGTGRAKAYAGAKVVDLVLAPNGREYAVVFDRAPRVFDSVWGLARYFDIAL